MKIISDHTHLTPDQKYMQITNLQFENKRPRNCSRTLGNPVKRKGFTLWIRLKTVHYNSKD